MHEIDSDIDAQDMEATDSDDTQAVLHLARSGTYTRLRPTSALYEELRLDVDGRYPQMTASGVLRISPSAKVHWIANVTASGANTYSGTIWYHEPSIASAAHTTVTIKVTPTLPALRRAIVVFTGGGLPPRRRIYRFASPYFHSVEFEFDSETAITPETSIDTCEHPTHPATLACETLSIAKVFQRAGFRVSSSTDEDVIPVAGAGPDTVWSNAEMHDTMQTYWSRFSALPRWAMWTFFARQHEDGFGLGGIMFDDIGAQHRQGTSLFYDSFISEEPASDPNPAAFARRMRFWTVVHEMGHSFNLAHAFQKALGAPYGSPWIPLADDPEARSFMNYPFLVAGGADAFFSDFEYRFSDQELLFLRHAPERFVQMGNEAWFSNHGFENLEHDQASPLALTLRFNRPTAVFEFLEPVVAELKLTNITNEPYIIDGNTLRSLERVTIVSKRERGAARRHRGYAQLLLRPQKRVLEPGESLYESVFLSAGVNGFDLAEPGNYVLQAAYHGADGTALSRPLGVRVRPPRNYDEESFAQDFYSDAVGRVLAFDGSRVLQGAIDCLKEAADRHADRAVAIHAQVALAMPLIKPGVVLDLARVSATTQQSAAALGASLRPTAAQLTEALSRVETVLSKPNEAAETLGHIDLKYYADKVSRAAAKQGRDADASALQATTTSTLKARGVPERILRAPTQPATAETRRARRAVPDAATAASAE